MPRPTLIIAILVGGIALFSVNVKRRLLEVTSSTTKLRVHQDAPPFILADRHGAQFELHEVAKRNKVVLINFWATWCGPCRVELPQFEKLYKDKPGRGLEILAINEDQEPDKLTDYLAEKPLSFPVLIDSGGAVAKAYGVQAFPTSVLVDSDGRVLQIISGVQPYLDQMIEFALKASNG